MMYIARILYPVKVLGPGERIGIWFAGCKHHCLGCSNPELWEANKAYLLEVWQAEEMIRNITKRNSVDGFTLTGGEPMEQATDISKLLEVVNDISNDVILYTGYMLEELVGKEQKKLLEQIAVLIDGRYREEFNDGAFLRGSANQKIHILNEVFREKYEEYLQYGKNEIQNFTLRNGIISVGIHNPGFKI